MKTINVDSHNVPATARSKNYQTALATTAVSGGGATTTSVVAPTGGAADTAKVAQNLAEDSTDWAKILRKDIDERTENSLSIGKNLTVDGQAILNDVVANTGTFSGMLKAAAATITGALLARTVSATTMNATTFIGELHGNAATATKLQTARTIWGQSFDGSGNVDGTLSLNANAASRNACLNVTANNSLGNGGWNWVASFLAPNSVIGEHIFIPIGKSFTTGNSAGFNFVYQGDNNDATFIGLEFFGIGTNFALTKAGNVGIGTTSPAYKLDVNGNMRVTSNLYADATVGTRNFASRTTGWRADANGNADFRNIYADELRVQAFTADISQALAGSDYLTKSVSKLSANFVVPSVNSTVRIIVDDIEGMPATQCFSNNDYIRFRAFNRTSGLTIANVWGTVTLDTTFGTNGFSNGTQAYTFTCKQTSGAGLTVFKGSEVLDYGTSGSGLIARTTLDTMGSPYEQIATWKNDPSNGNNYTVHARLGNLNGIANCSGYGLYTDNGFFTGKITVGDLTKSNHYLDFSNGALTVKGNIYLSSGDGVVGSNGVISAINLTRETAIIQANKINLNGAVTIGAIDKSSVTPAALGAATPTDVNTAVDDIQIGGRNLIRNGDFSNGESIFISNGYTSFQKITTDLPNGFLSGGKFSVPQANKAFYYYLNNNGIGFTAFENGVTYTISCYAKASVACSMQWGMEGVNRPNTNLTTSWQRFSLQAVGDGANHAICFYPQVACTFYITGIQLEKGNKETSWTPAPEDVDASINGIQIGCRNLLTNSKTFEGYFKLGYWTKENDLYNGCTVYSMRSAWNGLYHGNDLYKAGTYTFSFWIKGTSDIGIVQYFDGLSGISNSGSSKNCYTLSVTTDWKRVSITFTITSPTILASRIEKADANGTVYICGYKLEEGNKATTWSPSPEDVDSSISAVQSTADAALTRNNTMAVKLGYTDYNALASAAALGHTLINGGMINTVLINATAVVTNGLTANCITANMISAGSITADNIDANSVSTKIANVISLDAGRIKTGILSADRIDVANVVTKGIAAHTIDAQNATIKNLKMETAEVSGKIIATSGSVGPFSIGTYLSATSGNNNLILNADLIGFTQGTRSAVYMGGDVMPAGVSLACPMRVEESRSTDVYGNAGIYISVTGASIEDSDDYSSNSALYITKGVISGLRPKIRRLASSQTLSIMDHTIIDISSSYSTYTFPSGCEDGQEYVIYTTNLHCGIKSNSSNISGVSGQVGVGIIVDIYDHLALFCVYDAYNNKWWVRDTRQS